jgi:hypothetical protein
MSKRTFFFAARRRSLVLAAAALLAAPAVSEASSALSRGQRIGSLSAKLLQKPYNTLTATQQSQVICDPIPATEGSTSIFYDRSWASEFGTTRISITDLVAGPKYNVSGLVEVLVPAAGDPVGRVSSVSPRAELVKAYQPIYGDNGFLNNPAGPETGYAQIFFTLNNPGGADRMDPFDEGFELKEEVGVVEGGVDTHAFLFETKSGTPENTQIPITHFASDGSFTGIPDRVRAIGTDDQGLFIVTLGPGGDPGSTLEEASVTAPEPGAVALLALGALGLLRRRARRD